MEQRVLPAGEQSVGACVAVRVIGWVRVRESVPPAHPRAHTLTPSHVKARVAMAKPACSHTGKSEVDLIDAAVKAAEAAANATAESAMQTAVGSVGWSVG